MVVTPVPADQIEYDDESGEIIVGTITDHLGTIVKSLRSKSGGMLVLKRSEPGAWEVEQVLQHDGNKLDQISAAARYGDLKVFGFPFSEGVLVCEI